MYPHRIRLRGPWTFEPLWRFLQDDSGTWQQSTENLPPAFRMTMPGRWSDAGLLDFRGGVRCVRPFGYPGRIDDTERVWLTFAGLDGRATVTLNDQPLGTIDGAAEFEITALLKPHNNLRVEIESPEPSGGLWGEVALEIRATAFLREVRFECGPDRLTARGLAVGEAPRPLDLYLFAADRFLTHELVQPAPTGQVFELSGDLTGQAWPSPLPVRVELIDAATIWYVVVESVDRKQSDSTAGSS